jgi:hypothetical protein
VKRSRAAGAAVLALFAAAGMFLVLRARPGSRPPAREHAGAAAPASPSSRTPFEDQAISGAIAPGFRVATEEDAADSEARDDLRALYGDYQPYFVRGDFDGDGRLDFAQAFIRRDGPEPLFDVAVFFGTVSGFSPPVWVERGLPLSTGDLSADRSVLIVMEDVEQEVSRRWRWEPSAGRFVDVDAGTDGDEEEGTEPNGRLGKTA